MTAIVPGHPDPSGGSRHLQTPAPPASPPTFRCSWLHQGSESLAEAVTLWPPTAVAADISSLTADRRLTMQRQRRDWRAPAARMDDPV